MRSTQPGYRLFDLPEHPDESCTQSNHDNQEHQCQRRRCEHVQHPRCDANDIPQTTVSVTQTSRRGISSRRGLGLEAVDAFAVGFRVAPASSLERFLGDGLGYFGLFCALPRAGREAISAAAANTLDLAIDRLVLLIDLDVAAPLRACDGRPRPWRSRRTGRYTAAGVDAGPRRLRGASAVGAGRWRRRAPGRVRRAAWIFAGVVQSAWGGGSRRDAANALRAGAGRACARGAGGAAAAAAAAAGR
jgi:hypothetical protein